MAVGCWRPSLDPSKVQGKQKQILAENKYFLYNGEPGGYMALTVSSISFEEQTTYLWTRKPHNSLLQILAEWKLNQDKNKNQICASSKSECSTCFQVCAVFHRAPPVLTKMPSSVCNDFSSNWGSLEKLVTQKCFSYPECVQPIDRIIQHAHEMQNWSHSPVMFARKLPFPLEAPVGLVSN